MERKSQKTHWRVPALAKKKRISAQSIYTLIARGEIRCVRLGRTVFVPDDEAERIPTVRRDDEKKSA